MKSIELTQNQIKAYENGVTMFIFPIAEKLTFEKENVGINMIIEKSATMNLENVGLFSGMSYVLKYLLENHSPLQIGDKDIFIKEDFDEIDISTYYSMMPTSEDDVESEYIYKANYSKRDKYSNYMFPSRDKKISDIDWQTASQMTKEQSRYRFKECIDIRIVRLQDITVEEAFNTTRLSKSIGMTPLMDMVDLINIQLEEQNINRTYKDNDYVFLMEFKR